MGKYNVFARSGGASAWIGAVLAASLAACAARTVPPGPRYSPPPGPESESVFVDPASQEPETEPLAPQLRADAPLRYTVQRGDTLWGIAQKFLLDPWQWPEIWYVNERIANPHRIYPGDVLSLVQIDGRTRLTLDERLLPRMRAYPLESAIPMIRLDAIRDFLRGPRILTEEELNGSGYVLSFVEDHIVGGTGNEVYVRSLPQDGAETYAVLRRTEPRRDPDDGALLGYEAIPTGEISVLRHGDPTTAVLSAAYREVLVGDRVLPMEPEPFTDNVYPSAPPGEVEGRILAVFDGVSQIGQYQIVALNRGTNHGLAPGNVLDILQAGGQAADIYGARHETVRLPDQHAGQLLVFKCTPRLSYGIVMLVTRPVHALDKVVSPVSGR